MFTKIFGNIVNPDQFESIQERKNPYACIYGSNYAQGLEILLDHWPEIKRQFPRASLDIYYGWQHWAMLAPEKEAKMRLQITLAPTSATPSTTSCADLEAAYRILSATRA